MTYDECFIGQRVKVSGLYHNPDLAGEKGTVVWIDKDHYVCIVLDNQIQGTWHTAIGKSAWNVRVYSISSVDEPPVKIDKCVATAMFRAVSFGTMGDDSDFIFHRLLPEAIYLKLGGKSSMCPVTRQCFANDCKACWQRVLTMEGYPDSLYWEYAEFKKEECI